MTFKHVSINAWRDFYQVCFERNTSVLSLDKQTVSLTNLANLFRQSCNKFSFLVRKTQIFIFLSVKNSQKFPLNFQKAVSTFISALLWPKVLRTSAAVSKTTVRKFFSRKKAYFHIFWNVSLDTAKALLTNISKSFAKISNNFWWTSEKKITKRCFEKKTIRTFLWQSWQKVPAKRPKSFPLRPENIIFSDKDIQKSSIEKVENSFEKPVIFVLPECPENYRSTFEKFRTFRKQRWYFWQNFIRKCPYGINFVPIEKRELPNRSLWTQKKHILKACGKFCTESNKILQTFFFLNLKFFLNCAFSHSEDFSSDNSFEKLLPETAGRLCFKFHVSSSETLQCNPRDNSNAVLTTLPEAFCRKFETICSSPKNLF